MSARAHRWAARARQLRAHKFKNDASRVRNLFFRPTQKRHPAFFLSRPRRDVTPCLAKIVPIRNDFGRTGRYRNNSFNGWLIVAQRAQRPFASVGPKLRSLIERQRQNVALSEPQVIWTGPHLQGAMRYEKHARATGKAPAYLSVLRQAKHSDAHAIIGEDAPAWKFRAQRGAGIVQGGAGSLLAVLNVASVI